MVACTGCACFIFVFDEDFEMDVVHLSEEELLQKHRKERKELQGKVVTWIEALLTNNEAGLKLATH